MKNINLTLPIVVRNTLTDMSAHAMANAYGCLDNKLCMVLSHEGSVFCPVDSMPTGALFGSYAVMEYRHLQGLSDVVIRNIPVMDIVDKIEHFNVLGDILGFLEKVHRSNSRLERMFDLSASGETICEEYAVLQRAVEYLLDNNWNGTPLKDKFGFELYSLKDVGFKVVDDEIVYVEH